MGISANVVFLGPYSEKDGRLDTPEAVVEQLGPLLVGEHNQVVSRFEAQQRDADAPRVANGLSPFTSFDVAVSAIRPPTPPAALGDEAHEGGVGLRPGRGVAAGGIWAAPLCSR